MSKEARRLKRAEREGSSSRARKDALKKPLNTAAQQLPEQLKPEYLRSAIGRAALPVAGAWLLGVLIYAVSQSTAVRVGALAVPAVVTLVVAVVFGWAARQASKARGVAEILASAGDEAGRQAALEKLETGYKSKDPAKVFAKAQLLMQKDPREALVALEEVDLAKAPAAVADQARAQRALLHLMLGDVTRARDLADGIDISRHKDLASRAFMSSVVSEAWARSGQAKRAEEMLGGIDADDANLAQVRPQLLRARAFIAAYRDNPDAMRLALRKLQKLDPRLLSGFLMKQSHPLLQKEAKKMLEKSGLVSRKMQVQRR